MPLCCSNCFEDKIITEHIISLGKKDDCDFCDAKNVYTIKSSDLEVYFRPVVEVYEPVDNIMGNEELKEYTGSYIWEILDEDWEVFSDDLRSGSKLETLFKSIMQWDLHEGIVNYDSYFMWPGDYFGDADDIEGGWDELKKEIIFRNRYFPEGIPDIEYIKDVFRYITVDVDIGKSYFRSRRDPKNEFDCTKMGKPAVEKTLGGRANPRGIPYLYLATDRETAISEIRPSVGELVAVAEFRAIAKAKVISLIPPLISSPFVLGDEVEMWLRYIKLLIAVGDELSRPILEGADSLEYIPTQYICEYFKKLGYAGVIFGSSRGAGSNITIFEDGLFECVATEHFLIDTVSFNATAF